VNPLKHPSAVPVLETLQKIKQNGDLVRSYE